MSTKYEQLIEYIINDDEAKARELFHQIVVEKSRDIYESLIDEQDLEEVGGNPVGNMVDEISADEEGMQEDEEEFDSEEDSEEDEDGRIVYRFPVQSKCDFVSGDFGYETVERDVERVTALARRVLRTDYIEFV